MRVLYAYRYGIVGGVYTQLSLRRRALNDAGIHCDIFFSQDNGIGYTLSDREGFYFGSDVSFRRLVKRGRFDAVIVIDTPELLGVAAGSFLRRNEVYLDVHTTTNTGLAYLADIRSSRLTGVMVPTNYSASLVRSRIAGGVNISVTPNILETNLFSPSLSHKAINESGHVGGAPREFVWVGKLDHHKNWRLALVYTALLRDLFCDVRMHIIGGYTAPASQAEAFFELAYRLGISSEVSWLDRVDNRDLVDIYRRCASTGGAMLVTSRDESFGMAAAEALMCGCPLIANDLPVFREVFPESSLVKRVDIWKPDQLAAAAASLSDRPSAEAVSSLHRQLAKKYGPEAFVDSFKSLFPV